jgi:hypothetical protein
MKLTDQLTDYTNAAFTGLWLQTFEPDEAERELIRQARQQWWKLAVWDVANGLRLPLNPNGEKETGAGDPLAALRALPSLGDEKGTALLLLHNFHRFLSDPEVIQTTFSQLIAGKQQRTFIVVLSPVVQIPVELEKLFIVLEHPLADPEQLAEGAAAVVAVVATAAVVAVAAATAAAADVTKENSRVQPL